MSTTTDSNRLDTIVKRNEELRELMQNTSINIAPMLPHLYHLIKRYKAGDIIESNDLLTLSLCSSLLERAYLDIKKELEE